MSEKKNCWEVKQCGREPGGRNAEELGVCAAASEKRLDGIHGGKNGGRCCWAVCGTLCGGQVQGTYARKFKSCEQCEFYSQVWQEEFPRCKYTNVIRRHLEEPGGGAVGSSRIANRM